MSSNEIESLRLEIQTKVDQLYALVKPTDEELALLHDDLKQNPADYACNLENNRYWIALTVLDNRETGDPSTPPSSRYG